MVITEFSSAMEQGFRSGGWKGALTKGVEVVKGHRKLATRLRLELLNSMPSWETKIRLSGGSTPLIRSVMRN
jgi:hypothetical protein